jgi:hypothetical protein
MFYVMIHFWQMRIDYSQNDVRFRSPENSDRIGAKWMNGVRESTGADEREARRRRTGAPFSLRSPEVHDSRLCVTCAVEASNDPAFQLS